MIVSVHHLQFLPRLGFEAIVLKNARVIDALFDLVQVAIVFHLAGLFMVFVQDRYERMSGIRGAKND